MNIRFSTLEYDRLKKIADYRGISVTTPVHHVLTNNVLPRLEREMKREQGTGKLEESGYSRQSLPE